MCNACHRKIKCKLHRCKMKYGNCAKCFIDSHNFSIHSQVISNNCINTAILYKLTKIKQLICTSKHDYMNQVKQKA